MDKEVEEESMKVIDDPALVTGDGFLQRLYEA